MTRPEREAQLLQVAEEVLVERGYQDTTIEEIAERAGITKPVIYDHFKSKDELLLRVITRAHAELEWATVAAAREVSDPSDAEELVSVVTRAWFEFIDGHRAAFALMRQERYLALGQVERIRVDQSRVLAGALRRTRQFADLAEERLEVLGNAIVGITERYSIWRLDRPEISTDQASEDVTGLIWNGISGSAAQT